jgi:hypothetical protein
MMKDTVSLEGLRLSLEKGTKNGFLIEAEIDDVFSHRTNMEKVWSLKDIIRGKDNAAFDAFCRILEDAGYSNWSLELKRRVRLPVLFYLDCFILHELAAPYYSLRVWSTVGLIIDNGLR